MKKSYANNKFKMSAPMWNKNLNYQLVKMINKTVADHPPIRIYVNKIGNRITFKIKTVYYLEFLTPETMKLLGSSENKISKNESGENLPQLQSY